MTPYNLTFEQWLLKTNPQLTHHDLIKHEEYLGRAMQLSMERELHPNNQGTDVSQVVVQTEGRIKDALKRANELVAPKDINRVANFWILQKQYIAMQRDVQQIALFRKDYIKTSALFFGHFIQMQLYIWKKSLPYMLKSLFTKQ